MALHRLSTGIDLKRLILPTVIAGIVLAIVGCSAGHTLSNGTAPNEQFREYSARQSEELSSYAALLRVKLKRDRRVDDFRVEIFSRQDDQLSLYVRGFLGSAVLKAVVSGDSFECFFPREKRFYRGLVADLETGSLSDSRHIIDLLLSFYRGSYEVSEDGVWQTQIKKGGKSFRLKMVDTLNALRIESKLHSREEFPYLRAENIKLESRDRSFIANIAVQSSTFNRMIPEEKFALEIPDVAVVLTRDDLAELLTNLAQ